MKTIRSIDEWDRLREALPDDLGFVPTMGALHDGHLSLIELSQEQTPLTVVSIFVNPTQFNDPGDIERYPRDVQRDEQILRDLGVDYLFIPEYETVYPDGYRYRVTESAFSQMLCGASRPGHFDGVLTVVLRLLNIVRPGTLFLGEKDYQQYALIRDMVQSFHLGVDVVMGPTVRNGQGVALSSRNARLSDLGMNQAAIFARRLKDGSDPPEIRNQLEADGIEVDYIEELEGRRFGAVVVEGVRLIDNVRLNRPAGDEESSSN